MHVFLLFSTNYKGNMVNRINQGLQRILAQMKHLRLFRHCTLHNKRIPHDIKCIRTFPDFK